MGEEYIEPISDCGSGGRDSNFMCLTTFFSIYFDNSPFPITSQILDQPSSTKPFSNVQTNYSLAK
jgi:hypothetical protein